MRCSKSILCQVSIDSHLVQAMFSVGGGGIETGAPSLMMLEVAASAGFTAIASDKIRDRVWRRCMAFIRMGVFSSLSVQFVPFN